MADASHNMAKPAPQSVAQCLPPFSHTGQFATAGRLVSLFCAQFRIPTRPVYSLWNPTLVISWAMDREERAVLAAWERAQDAERKRCAQQNRRIQRASRKQQVHHLSVPSTHLASHIA